MMTRLVVALSFSLVACGQPVDENEVTVDSSDSLLSTQAAEDARRERTANVGEEAQVASLDILPQERVLFVTVSEAMSADVLLSRLDVGRFSWRCEVSTWKSDVVAQLSCTELTPSRGAEARVLPWFIGRTEGVAYIEVR